MSEVTQLKQAVEQAAGPAAGEIETTLNTAEKTAWAKYKAYVIAGAVLVIVAVGYFIAKVVF